MSPAPLCSDSLSPVLIAVPFARPLLCLCSSRSLAPFPVTRPLHEIPFLSRPSSDVLIRRITRSIARMQFLEASGRLLLVLSRGFPPRLSSLSPTATGRSPLERQLLLALLVSLLYAFCTC